MSEQLSETEPTNDHQTEIELARPPAALLNVLNPVVTAVLRSPLHGLLSHRLLLLDFAGRRSGRRYRFPVGYFELDGELVLSTAGKWRLNFTDGAQATVVLRGNRTAKRAELVTNPDAVARTYIRLVNTMGWRRAQRLLGIKIKSRRPPMFEEFARIHEREGLSAIRLLDPAST